MPIITLTSDFGYKDPYVSAIKGRIISELNQITIIDISHSIDPFNIQECAYILKNSYKNFPEGSIHLVGVDAEKTPENEHVVTFVDGHYFITANNGVICLITQNITPEKVISIQLPNTSTSSFPELEIFTKVACHIARGGTLELIGKPFNGLKLIKEFAPRVLENGNIVVGSIIYIDNYGNVITNIEKSLFESYRNGRDFEISARNNKLKEVHQTYSGFINFDLEKNQRKGPGDLMALFNSSGYLELAIYKSNIKTVGSAATLIGLTYRDTITINFL